MSGAVIELDLGEPWDPEPAPTTRWPPRLPRWLPPVAVAVVTLLALAAAAPPRRWDPVLSVRNPNSAVSFGPDDTAYVTTQRTNSSRLQAYPPGHKRALWTVNNRGGFSTPVYMDDPDFVTVMVFEASPDGQGRGNAVQQRDARTGDLVWSRTGVGLLGMGRDVVVLSDRQEVGGSVPGPLGDRSISGVEAGPGVVVAPGWGVAADPAGPTGSVEAVDRRTGRSLWSRQVPKDALVGSESVTGDRAPLVAELDLDGVLRLSDPVTGELRRETRVTLIGRPVSVSVIDGRVEVLLLPSAGREQLTVTYDLATGAELSREETLASGFCGGRYLCENTEPGQLIVTDAASGAVVFRGRGDTQFVDGDRLIVSWDARWPDPAGTEVYDLRTGRRINAYPGWQPSEFGPGGGLLMSQQLAGGGLLVGIRDSGTGRLTVVGRGTGWSGRASCSRGVRYVGCAGATGLQIWRLP